MKKRLSVMLMVVCGSYGVESAPNLPECPNPPCNGYTYAGCSNGTRVVKGKSGYGLLTINGKDQSCGQWNNTHGQCGWDYTGEFEECDIPKCIQGVGYWCDFWKRKEVCVDSVGHEPIPNYGSRYNNIYYYRQYQCYWDDTQSKCVNNTRYSLCEQIYHDEDPGVYGLGINE